MDACLHLRRHEGIFQAFIHQLHALLFLPQQPCLPQSLPGPKPPTPIMFSVEKLFVACRMVAILITDTIWTAYTIFVALLLRKCVGNIPLVFSRIHCVTQE